MELCDGLTLRQWLRRRDARGGGGGGGGCCVDWRESFDLVQQVAAGLSHVHEQGLVHRDLKPANCCFSRGVLKLIDFGLARPAAAKADADDIHLETVALRGGARGAAITAALRHQAQDGATHSAGVGTPSYAAPEQLRPGAAVSAACDVFPLALIAFELFHPFGSAMERAKIFGGLRRLGERSLDAPRNCRYNAPPCLNTAAAPALPAQLVPLLCAMLQHDPPQRPLCPTVMRSLMLTRAAMEAAAAEAAAPKATHCGGGSGGSDGGGGDGGAGAGAGAGPHGGGSGSAAAAASVAAAAAVAAGGGGTAAYVVSSPPTAGADGSPLTTPSIFELNLSPLSSPTASALTSPPPPPPPATSPSQRGALPLLQLPPAATSPTVLVVPLRPDEPPSAAAVAATAAAALAERDALIARQQCEMAVLVAELRGADAAVSSVSSVAR